MGGPANRKRVREEDKIYRKQNLWKSISKLFPRQMTPIDTEDIVREMRRLEKDEGIWSCEAEEEVEEYRRGRTGLLNAYRKKK